MQRKKITTAKKERFLLLGDVVGSRGIKNRIPFERKMKMALDAAMQLHSKAFLIPIKTWKGIDEVAAVLHKAGDVYAVMNTINDQIFPEKIRFVLVKGDLAVAPGVTDISRLDGSIFHVAAGIMLEIKKEKWLFKCNTGDATSDMALDTQVNSLFLLKSMWTQKQRDIYNLYLKSKNQADVAKKLRISQQSVSKALTTIAATQVIALENKLTAWAYAGFD